MATQRNTGDPSANLAHGATAVLPREAREYFARAWRRYLIEAHGGSARLIARIYGVDQRTAEFWLADPPRHVPNGLIVAMAFAQQPRRAAAHLRVVVDNRPPPHPAVAEPERQAS